MISTGAVTSPRIALIVPVIVLGLAVALAPLYYDRLVSLPAGTLASGPLHGGNVFFTVPILASLYVMFTVIIPYSFHQPLFRLGAFLRLPGWLARRFEWFLFVTCTFLYVNGISAYWSANLEGVTIHPDWSTPEVHHAWTDVTQRTVQCWYSRGGASVSYTLHFADGWQVDFADSQQPGLAENFATIDALTASAPTIRGRGVVSACPGYISAVLARQPR